jgi:hypothetical protein
VKLPAKSVKLGYQASPVNIAQYATLLLLPTHKSCEARSTIRSGEHVPNRGRVIGGESTRLLQKMKNRLEVGIISKGLQTPWSR